MKGRPGRSGVVTSSLKPQNEARLQETTRQAKDKYVPQKLTGIIDGVKFNSA